MTTLIKNIVLVDGSGKPPFKADVLIRGEKVVAIGNFPSYKADRVVNGNKSYLVPGFIDPDITSDRYMTLFSSPIHKNLIVQGVTSAILGQCGFSLAPNFYGAIGNFSNWAFSKNVNINWKTVKEFLDSLAVMRIGINVGTLVGHGTLRNDIVGVNGGKFRRLSAKELTVFRSVVENAMKDGSFGLSTGLGHNNFSETTYHEIRAILDIVKKFGGVYSTHLRDEKDGLGDSVDETIRISKELGIKTIITHLRPFIGFEEEYKNAVSKISKASIKSDVYFNTNPFNSSASLIGDLVPEKYRNENTSVFLEKLRDSKFATEISKQIPRLNSKKVIILNVPNMSFIRGKSLYEFAKNRKLSASMAIVNLMLISKLQATILYENLNKKVSEESVFYDRALISTSSPSFDEIGNDSYYVPERANETFTRFLKLSDMRGLRIESVIEKITNLPAKIFGISGRGQIYGGSFADLVVLSKNFEITDVYINGSLVYHSGEFSMINKDTAKALKRSKK